MNPWCLCRDCCQEALGLLERAYDDRAIALPGLAQNADLALLRDEPRFQALVRKVSLR